MRKIYINFKLKNTVHVLSIAKIARIGLFVSLMFAISAPGVYAATYGDTTAYAGNNANEDLILMQVNIPTAGVATMLHPCIQADSGSATIYGGIYSDEGGLPGSLLVGPTSTTVSNTTTQFVNIDIPDTVLAAGNYWLAVSLTNTGDDVCDNSTSNAAREYNLTTVSSWPSSVSGATIGRVGPIGYTIDVSPLTVGTGPAVSSFSDNFTTAQYETADTDYERIKQTGTADLESVGGVLTDGTCGSAVSDGAQYGTINTFTSADYEVSMYIPSLAPTGYHYQLLGRIQNATNYYALHAETGYRVWIGRIDNDAFTTLTSISNTTNLGSGDTLRLKIKGSRIDVIWDDSVKVSTTDTTFSSAGGAGFGMGTFNITTGAGIAGCSSSTQFDNFSVSTTISPDTTTESATNITATTADLRSTVNPNGSSTTVYYRYGTSNTDCSSLPSSGTYGNIGSGTANVSYNALNITGLTPGTTYYFCTYATNSGGTINGSVLSFSTPLSTPVIASPTKSSISYTTVTLGGNITNQGASAVTERGVCYSTSDNTPQLGEGSVTCQASGSGTGVFTADVTGLNANTLYYYRAYATNTQGTSYTSTDNFTTLTIQPPAIVVQAPTNLTSSTVTLNATANPNEFSTTAYFRVWPYYPFNCLDGGGQRWPEFGGTLLTGSTSQAFTENITGLLPQKTYYYCAIAGNAGGTNYHSGTPSNFTTPNGPQNSCDGSPTGAITIGGTANCSFPGSGNITGADGAAITLSSGAALTIQSGQTVVFNTLSKPGATINKIAGGVMRKGYIWVKDTDGDGFYDPSSVVFSTSAVTPPDVGYVRRSTLGGATYLSQAAECNDSTNTVTVPTCEPAGTAPNGATNITSTTATLNGVTNPNGDAGTRAYFKWGSTNTGDCETLASSTSATLLSGTTSQGYSANISGLSNLTTYYWCTIVYNNSGTSIGDIDTFVAQNSVPSLSTPTSSSITSTTATLGATVTSNGGAALTARGTCWGVSPAPTGNCTAEGGTSVSAFTHARSGLTAGTTIYFRGYATNSVGTGYSADGTFQTLPSTPSLGTVYSQTVFNRSDLSWSASTGGTAYFVNWCRGSGCTPNANGTNFGQISVGNVTSYQHSTGYACGQIMRYSVFATGPTGTSATSSVQEVTTLCPLASAPTGVANSSSQITVTYGSVSGATGYGIYRCTTSNCSSQTGPYNDTASTYPDTGLSGSTTYYYRIKATSSNATSDYSSISSGITTQAACTNGYKDYDGDGYGAGSYSCWDTGSYTIVGTGGDCYDNPAAGNSTLAKPGTSTYRTSTRGTSGAGNDWAGNTWNSFDYNCDSSVTIQYGSTMTNYPYTCTTGCSTAQNTPGWTGAVNGAPSSANCGQGWRRSYGCTRYSDTSCNVSMGSGAANCGGAGSCFSSDQTITVACY